MIAIAIINLLIPTALVIYLIHRMSENETIRFREFVKAEKSKNVQEYTEVIPEVEEKEEIIPDELVELENVDETQLLNTLSKEYENQ